MGTTIYEIELQTVKDFYKDNVIIEFLLDEDGFAAFDLDKFYDGYQLEGDTLYLVVTDYVPFTAFGKEIEDPDSLLIDYTVDDLRDEGLVEPVTDTIIKRYLSEDELAPFDIDWVATTVVEETGTFSEVARCLNRMDMLESLL